MKDRQMCLHYSRGCSLRAPCCGEVFSCRLCHDICKHDMEPEAKRRHKMNRFDVKTVTCNNCGHEQSPQACCEACGDSFGAYFCGVCNLFDDDVSKQQFHCDKCGICRVGGRANFFHCDKCGACYGNELLENHVCVSNAMRRDCPICCEYLFDSLDAPQVLRCGHALHRKCLEDYSAHGGYTCPLCCASVCDMQTACESCARPSGVTRSGANGRACIECDRPSIGIPRISSTRRSGSLRCPPSSQARAWCCCATTATCNLRRRTTCSASSAAAAARTTRGGYEVDRLAERALYQPTTERTRHRATPNADDQAGHFDACIQAFPTELTVIELKV
uniref:RING finger and CHY zinc finger domain-containing protein 1 n=1 Tax=Chrysotila carterae TaxID=13221 RepID=A0A7S4C4L2_CHRCT